VIGRGRLLADTPLADFVPDGSSLEDAYLRLTAGAGAHRTGLPGGRPGTVR